MLNLLNYDGEIEINGVTYRNSSEALEKLANFSGPITIKLNKKAHTSQTEQNEKVSEATGTDIYRIQVKKYMTQKSTPSFDFMKKWNNDNPMPFVVMYGEIIDETKGMYKMKLHARVESNSSHCMHCGRTLTNIVSRNYGIGPICGGHMNIAPPETIEEFKRREAEIRKTIEGVKWEGWVIKSAIKSMKKVETIQKKEQTA